ncbi:alpha/beta fold hydrolase [Flavobacterium jejuense]|uniref:Alpha/beta fold hydrolase n=1 Tax=Flavobacterium jejuense TaxID=1544455 RepID=A0ABX0IVF3_9FLAO|nr:alpha/beta hydrolase [Flavobacterium jejuense]NHN27890.1 alpha/beta fold hydrolase [Flavobacterium jejuense]
MSKRKKNISTNSIPSSLLKFISILQKVSTKLTVKFASKLFGSPIKYKIPKREFHMEKKSKQELLYIPKIKKQIMIYQYGENSKKVLLVHGWSGRGTQLVKIADKLIELGYSTISFDAPAHGKSPSKKTLMPEFIESILELDRKFGPFEYAIGHSLGSMSILNAIKDGLKVQKAIIIGSGDSVNDILKDFVSKLGLKPIIAEKMRDSFEKKHAIDMESFSSNIVARKINIPTLIIHDKNDTDVPYTASKNIHLHLKNSKLILTEDLGHRKILGDEKVIQEIESFLSN